LAKITAGNGVRGFNLPSTCVKLLRDLHVKLRSFA
jgi:hypothetical protein